MIQWLEVESSLLNVAFRRFGTGKARGIDAPWRSSWLPGRAETKSHGSDCPATRDEVDEKYHEGYDQQGVDDIPPDMHGEAEYPQQQQYADDRV